MAKLNGLFSKFISNIEPPVKTKEYAQEAHTRVRDFIETDEEFKDYVSSTFLYGFYKRNTAIGNIKDVDIVILTKFTTDISPQDALSKLKSSLSKFYKDPKNLEYQTRSIKVLDPLPDTESSLTLDIIPAIPLGGEDDPVLIPDRDIKEWIETHPKGHLSKTTKLNNKQNYVPFVKIIKNWWKYQSSIKLSDNKKPKPKGFWLECLVSQNFDQSKGQWADQFINFLRSVSNSYSNNSDVPELIDPGLIGKTIKTGMTKEEFSFFINVVNETLNLAIQATREDDEYESSIIWRKIFGEDFPIALKKEEYSLITKDATPQIALQDHSHKKELSDLGIKIVSNPDKIIITAEVYFGKSSSKVINRSYVGKINSGCEAKPFHWIRYVAGGIDLSPYNIYWQVVNTGAHALKMDGLRGEIFIGDVERWEQSLYTGKHWIECFAVNENNICVARSEPFYVIFRNPSFPYYLLGNN